MAPTVIKPPVVVLPPDSDAVYPELAVKLLQIEGGRSHYISHTLWLATERAIGLQLYFYFSISGSQLAVTPLPDGESCRPFTRLTLTPRKAAGSSKPMRPPIRPSSWHSSRRLPLASRPPPSPLSRPPLPSTQRGRRSVQWANPGSSMCLTVQYQQDHFAQTSRVRW